jgi:predicted transcriptional regulator
MKMLPFENRRRDAISYRLPPLNALRAFEASARRLSFKRAADELSVTAGAVSQQVKSLDNHRPGCTSIGSNCEPLPENSCRPRS